MGGAILVIMVTASRSPSLQEWLTQYFALSWTDLVDGELWRIFSFALIQPRGEILLGNVVMTVTLLPTVEWWLGSRKALVSFWVGHAVAILVVLVGTRISAALGNETAALLISMRDAGSSAGLTALVGLLVAQAKRPRYRTLLLAGLLTFHSVAWVLNGELANPQHIVAILVGLGLGRWWLGLAADPDESTMLPSRSQ